MIPESGATLMGAVVLGVVAFVGSGGILKSELEPTTATKINCCETNVAETKSIPNDQIVCTEFDGGEGILVDLNTKRYYQLNETALLIWKGLQSGSGIDEIVAEVVAAYDVQPQHARSSVENLLTRLRSYKLVSE